MKKICYVLPRYESDDHTHFAHLHDFIVELAKQADVFLIVESAGAETAEAIKNSLPAKKIYAQKYKTAFFKCFENFFVLLGARFSGYKDFYIHYSFMSTLNASLIARASGGRTFYWNCGLPWQYKRNFLRDLFERLTYQLISHLVTGTNSLAKEYSKHYNISLEKIKIMPNWISRERFKPDEKQIRALRSQFKLAQNDKVLLFVHRLSPRKGAHLLPEIFEKVICRGQTPIGGLTPNVETQSAENVKLLIIGSGPDEENLKFKISAKGGSASGGKNLKLESRVRLLGWVPNKELPNYYALANVFLMPSEEEGFPRVLLEAMAVGLPFVAFDVGGVREIAPKEFYKHIVPIGDIEGFAAAVNNILNWSKDERAAWQKTASEWIEQYETEAVIKKFLKIF